MKTIFYLTIFIITILMINKLYSENQNVKTKIVQQNIVTAEKSHSVSENNNFKNSHLKLNINNSSFESFDRGRSWHKEGIEKNKNLILINKNGKFNSNNRGACWSVSNNNSNLDKIIIYPNPAHNICTIDLNGFTKTNNIRIEVIDVIGIIIQDFIINEDITILDLKLLHPGYYNVRIYSQGIFVNNPLLVY